MSSDPISNASSHLISYMKLVADTLWEVQQMATPDPAHAVLLGARLAASADEMDRLVGVIPDFAAIVGPRESVDARLRAGEIEQDALAAQLERSIVAGEAALAKSNLIVCTALAAALDSESDDDNRGGVVMMGEE